MIARSEARGDQRPDDAVEALDPGHRLELGQRHIGDEE
jgi:hypothetical protein